MKAKVNVPKLCVYYKPDGSEWQMLASGHYVSFEKLKSACATSMQALPQGENRRKGLILVGYEDDEQILSIISNGEVSYHCAEWDIDKRRKGGFIPFSDLLEEKSRMYFHALSTERNVRRVSA